MLPALRFLSTARSRVCFHVLAALCLGVFGVSPMARSGPPAADETKKSVDKSQYNLFNPTPDGLLRPFKSDRPDQTVGPGSVDAGHYYFESGFSYSLDLGETRTDTWNFAQPRLRIGLLNSTELEFIYDGAYDQRSREVQAGGNRTDATVVAGGALTLRVRQNLFGNDEGKVSFALIPQIVLPISTEHFNTGHVQGSLILPVSIKLPGGFSTTIHNEFGVMRNDANTTDVASFVQGITLYHDIAPKTKAYVEYYGTVLSGPGSTFQGQADLGFLFNPIKNVQLDIGCNFGVTADAPDYQPFAGLVVRY